MPLFSCACAADDADVAGSNAGGIPREFWIATCRPYGSPSIKDDHLLVYKRSIPENNPNAKTKKWLKKEGPQKLALKCRNVEKTFDTWCGQDLYYVAGAEQSKMTSVLPEELKNRIILLYVHGFKSGVPTVARAGKFIYETTLETNKASLKEHGKSAVVMVFVWPSMKNPLIDGGGISYYKAREMAKEFAAPNLRSLLNWLNHDLHCKVILTAHSLGSHVTLECLRDRSDSETKQPPIDKLEHLLLIAAAVPHWCLDGGKKHNAKFPRKKVAAKNICVFYNNEDPVLKRMFPLGDSYSRFKKPSGALGRVGRKLIGITEGFAGDKNKNVTSDNKEDNKHSATVCMQKHKFTKKLNKVFWLTVTEPMATQQDEEDEDEHPVEYEEEDEQEEIDISYKELFEGEAESEFGEDTEEDEA